MRAARLFWLAACSDESVCLRVVVVIVVAVDLLVDRHVARGTRRTLLLPVRTAMCCLGAGGRSSGEEGRNQGNEGNSY